MRSPSRGPVLFVVAIVLVAAAFAVDRYLAYRAAREERDASVEQLGAALGMLKGHPEDFGNRAGSARRVGLKTLVQESGARSGVTLVYVTESEKEAGKGLRERSVTARMGAVRQEKLVAFLSDVEERGGGAKVRELRLKPDKAQSGLYQAAECVVSLRVPGAKESAP
jgi:hypothetical protein